MDPRPPTVEVFADAATLADAVARRFISAATSAVAARGCFRVALSGGTTPLPSYRLLASPPMAGLLPWRSVECYWGDERCVAPDDPASNFLSARTALLDLVDVDPARIHRMRGEDDPTLAAAGYEQLLRREFRTPTGPPTMRPEGRFDLVLLGLGPDGHVASLLPGRLPSPTDERWVVPISAHPWTRLTLTPAVINAAREVVLLASGSAKADIVSRALAAPGPGGALPAHLIRPWEGSARWMLDAEAAAHLAR